MLRWDDREPRHQVPELSPREILTLSAGAIGVAAALLLATQLENEVPTAEQPQPAAEIVVESE